MVSAFRLDALIGSSVVHNLQLLQEELNSVFDVLLWNLNLAAWADVTGNKIAVFVFLMVDLWEIE